MCFRISSRAAAKVALQRLVLTIHVGNYFEGDTPREACLERHQTERHQTQRAVGGASISCALGWVLESSQLGRRIHFPVYSNENIAHALLQSRLANIWSVLTMNSHSCCELYLGMLPSPVEKCGNLISQYKKQGVLANMCLKDPEDMDLECFRGGGSKVFHLTFPPPFIA